MNSFFEPPPNGLAMRFLGSFAVMHDGVALDGFGYDKTRALLAYLALESGEGPHRREKLADLLWPDVPAETARGNLRRTLHDLRKTLTAGGAGEEFFVTSKSQLGFDRASTYWLDVEAFSQSVPASGADELEHLEQQWALYREGFLRGLSLRDAPDFENWLELRREAVQRQALQLLKRLIQCHEQHGQLARAIVLLHKEIELDPWAEDAHRRLMQLQARNGQTAAALAQFEVCRALLQCELGLEPEPQTLALVQAIRRGELTTPSWVPASVPNAERRQVCVLVCDIQAPHALPPEAAASVVAESHGNCMSIISTHGGHGIALHAGKILAYFGYPQAHEHAPVKVLEAALEMVRYAVGTSGLNIRLGVHCGWVVNDQRFNLPDATGLITQRASVLAEQAPSGEAAISPETAGLVEGYFLLSDVRETAGLRHFLLQGRSTARHRLQAAAHRLTPFVGRAAELRLLRALWERTRQGGSQALLIRAEAGMGKSRLIQMLEPQVASAGGAWFLLRCLPEFQHTPYHPLVDFLQHRLNQDGGPETNGVNRGRHLADWLASLGDALTAHLPVLAELLQLPQETASLPLSPSDKKRRLESALLDVFGCLAQQQPLLLLLEDVHWADASTLEWVQALLARPVAPCLLLMSARPEFAALPDLKTLTLPALSDRQAERLVRQTAGGADWDARALKNILLRADGIPLYIEEMARSLQADLQVEIPGTLWHLLAVRLELVGEARRLAQQAAAIGRDFSLELLGAVWDGPGDRIPAYLDRLGKAGLIQPQERGHYRFKHALFQDSAYQTLPLDERKCIHGRLARLFQGAFQHLAKGSPERLAQHLTIAGEPLAAAAAWLTAGRLAASRSANQDAVFHFESGLAQLRGLDMPGADGLELSLQAALGTTLVAMKGYGAEEAKVCFARSLELSRTTKDDTELFQVTWGLWLGGRSCTPEAFPLEFAEKLERIAQASGEPEHAMQVHYAYGNNLFWMARYPEAYEHLEQAVAIGRGLSSLDLVRSYGEDTGISSLSFQAWIHWIQGRPDTAVATVQAAIAAARQLGHAHTLGFALTFAAVLYRFMNKPQQTAALGQELQELSRRHGLLLWQAAAGAVSGWAAVLLGRPEGVGIIQQSVEASRKAMLVVEGTFLAFQVDALHHLGQHEACAAVAKEAIARCESRLDIYFLPEFLRLRGAALLGFADGHCAEGVRCLEQAMELACQQGAQSLELRAAVTMSKFATEAAVMQRLRQRMTEILTTCPELASSADGQLARERLG